MLIQPPPALQNSFLPVAYPFSLAKTAEIVNPQISRTNEKAYIFAPKCLTAKNTRMTRPICLFFSTLMFFSCGQTNSTTNKTLSVNSTKRASNEAVLAFTQKEIDLKHIKTEIVDTTFCFANTGGKPLVIQGTYVACGCVTTDYPTNAFAKGEQGYIKITLDTKRLKGFFQKKIHVMSTAENDMETISIKGFVE